MKTTLKMILGGALFGTVLFFTWPILLVVFTLKFIFTPFGMGRMMWMNRGRHFGPMGGMHNFAFADKIRTMNEEEYMQFKSRMGNRCC